MQNGLASKVLIVAGIKRPDRFPAGAGEQLFIPPAGLINKKTVHDTSDQYIQ